ncbi:MAG TPA: YihY/virulence factor BrkB family protein [Pirellulaceae bacterium]|nr:YihY/virulence factor BrkB family protein [Pirellulaceae bacterium]
MRRIVIETVAAFWNDECPRLAAALAFYLVFALPALLGFTVLVTATIVDREAVAARLSAHLEEAMGPAQAQQVLQALAQARQPQQSWWAALAGAAVLVLSATGALQELQTALNRAWGVEPDPRQGRFAFLWKRLVSLGLLLAMAALLLVSLVASWALADLGVWIDPYLPDWLSSRSIWIANGLLSLALVTILTAGVFKFMPDAEVAWTDVWVGAAVTALLFVAGKIGLSLYFTTAAPASAYGAAGSLALVLLWVYYSAQALLLGAEFTEVWARHRGRIIGPEPGAKPAAENVRSASAGS